jgi:hypothetical protein
MLLFYPPCKTAEQQNFSKDNKPVSIVSEGLINSSVSFLLTLVAITILL